MKRSKTASFAALTAAVAFGCATFAPSQARADEVSPDGKGIVGGALLGAEVVTLPMALFQVRSGAIYAIGGGVGAVGGGVAGYFIERASFSDNGRVPVYMLAGGLALIIPTTVLVLNATAYHPSENASEDHAPGNAPDANPGSAAGSVVVGVPAPATPATTTPPSTTPPSSSTNTTTPAPATGGSTPPEAPQSLIDFSGAHDASLWRLGVPVPEVRTMYSMAEQKQYGLPQGTELRLPIFHASF